MRGIKGILVTAVVALGAFFALNTVNGTVTANGDCSANAVIKCGTYSIDTLRSKFNNDSTKGTKNIFSYFGITSDTINNKKVRNGYVTRGGDVVVDGKVVASDAITAGRQYIAGSTKATYNGTSFYVRKPSVSFRQNSLSAYVFFNADGTFAGAVIKDCGNPVKAKNKITPKKPAVYCDRLSASRISKSNVAPSAAYRFTAKAHAVDGAKVTGYTYSFSDGTKVNTTKTSVDHTFKTAGTHTVSLTVKGTVNGKTVSVSGANCKVTVKVDKPEVPKQIKVCDLKTKKVITINEKDFDSKKHSKNLDDCKEAPKPKHPKVDINKTVNGKEHLVVKENVAFTYEVKVTNTGDVDLVNAVVTDKAPAGVKLTGANMGTVSANGSTWTYTISKLAVGKSMSFTLNAVVPKAVAGTLKNTVCVDTPTVPGNPDDCDDATVEVPEPNKVEVCEISTGNTVTVTEDQAKDTTKYAPVGDAKCKVEVCDTTTGTIVTIDKKDQDDDKYTTDLSKCEKVEVCNPETGEVITVNPVDQDKYKPVGDVACQETPEVPETPETPETPDTPETPVTELPQTGVAQAFSGVFGLGALTAASYYFVTSRRP